MTKVLITGGAGLIGSVVAAQLQREGFSVVTFDIAQPITPIGEHILGTIMSLEELNEAMKGVDYVVHLAAMLGVQRTEINRLECLDVNNEGTKNVFEACRQAGVKRVVFASSSEVYGESVKNPISETDPVMPKSVYAVTKLVGEEYAHAYHREHGLDFAIVRFFNVYGPGQVAEFVVPRFIRSVMRDEAPTVYGAGNQERCFCHVDDAAAGVVLALTKPEASGETFNIGNDLTGVTMMDLAQRVIAVSGKAIEPQRVGMEQSDRDAAREIVRRTADISKARRLLGYEPRIGLEEGIADVFKQGRLKDGWPNHYAPK